MYEHDRLVSMAMRWLRRYHDGRETGGDYLSSCTVVLREFYSRNWAIPDAIGFNADVSVVVECKATRSDFRADLQKSHRYHLKQLGNYRFYLTPQNLVVIAEVPEGWGLLYASKKQIKVVKPAPFHGDPEIDSAERDILYSIARRVVKRGLMKQILAPLPQG
jgi:hypothetical protein